MPRGSVEYLKKIVMIADAWETLRPNLVLSKMTVHQFKAAVMPSFTKRVEIEQARATLQRLMAERDSVDDNTTIMMLRVVNAVKSQPGEEGDDGELYAAMGYLTFSQKRDRLLQAMGEQRRLTMALSKGGGRVCQGDAERGHPAESGTAPAQRAGAG